MYALDPNAPSFQALRRLWEHDPEAQPLIALASALSRDSALAGTATAILGTRIGDMVTADELAGAVNETYPGAYSEAVANKIGRNAASTWTQAGHLAGRVTKTRVRVNPRPASVAYALFLASLEGREGELLFDALPVRAQDAPPHALREVARDAARRGWLDFRSIGGVTEVGFDYLVGSA